MTKSPNTVLPLLAVIVCLMVGFFVQKTSLDARPPKPRPPVVYNVRTRFALLHISRPEADRSTAKDKPWLQAQAAMFTSRDLLMNVMERLDLDNEWKLNASAVVDRLRRHLTVKLEPGTNIVALSFSFTDLNEAADITDAIRDVYEEYRNNEELERFKRLKRTPAPGQHPKPPAGMETIKILEKTGEVKSGKS